MGIKEDSSKENLTTRVTWSSSDEAIAEIDAVGVATAISTGVAIFEAAYSSDGRTLIRSAGITVNSASLESISITPADATIAAGTRVALTATGNYSDGSTQNISGSVSWQSADEDIVATGTANSNAVQASGISPGTTEVSATLNDISGAATITVTGAELASIAVTPPSASIAAGTQQQFVATGTFTDGSTQNLNENADWTSSNSSVASVGNDAADGGLATASESGDTTISATVDGISGEATLTVTSAELVSIAVTPSAPTIAAGSEQQFTATGTYTDNSTQDLTNNATWSSSDEDIASISNAPGQQGLASSSQQGTTTISATMNGVNGSTELTVGEQSLVSIDVTPTNPTIVAGTTQQFTATGNYSDNSTQDLTDTVSWRSSNTAVATVNSTGSNRGLATADMAGSSEISASVDGVSGTTRLTVRAPTLRSLEISPDSPSITLGDERQLTATGTFSDGSTQDLTATVTWAPTNSDIATVSNADGSEGLATAQSLGTITVTATSGDVSAETELTVIDRQLVTLTVTPVDRTIAVGAEQQFTATGNYNIGDPEDLTGAVSWSSSNGDVATVDNAAGRKGLATAVGVGDTNIEARLDGVVGSAELNVTAATLESLRVRPAEATVANGDSQQFTATGTFSDGDRNITNQVMWESSDLDIASVSNASGSQGLATGTAEGQINIRATLEGVSGSARLTVTAPRLTGIAVTPQNASIDAGGGQQYTATGSYSDNSQQDLTRSATWASSNENVASISAAGVATGNSAGDNVTISATFEGFEGEANLTVNEPPPVDPTLDRFQVTPRDASIEVEDTLQYTATGFYSDNTQQNLTESSTWISSNENVARIGDGVVQIKGVATGISAGDVAISASFEGFEDEADLEVTEPVVVEPTLERYQITPQDASIEVEGTLQYTATGFYSDNTQQDLTDSSTWSSSNENVANISVAGAPTGLAIGNSAGSVAISASFEGFEDKASLDVTVPIPDEPDLVVTRLETAGSASINRDGTVELPIRVTVRNQGGAAADIFKVAIEYTRVDTGGTFVVAFTVPGQSNTFYPFTSESLAAGSEVSFGGTLTFISSLRELTLSLNAIADSCSGDEFMPAFCRVDESDEGNNRSSAISVTLP